MVSLSQLRRYWRASARVYPEANSRAVVGRLRYVAQACRVAPILGRFLDASPNSNLGSTVDQRPQLLGFVVAPFMNASWDARKRMEAFLRQFHLLERLGPPFDFRVTESIELPHIQELGEDYTMILDKPYWFQREGLLTLNTFRGNLRLISLSFSFDEIDRTRTVIIGGIQGRRIEGALDEYRQLTRLAHGLRPRDLLIDYLRMIAAAMGVTRLIAVADSCRHHRHPYFGRNVDRELPLNYDEIWRDRGGIEVQGGFFELPLQRTQRPIEEVPAKKRSMYRQRYAMLERIESDFRRALPHLRPVTRPEAD